MRTYVKAFLAGAASTAVMLGAVPVGHASSHVASSTSSLVPGPPRATIAATAPALSTKVTSGVRTSPFPLGYYRKLPVLSGSTAAARTAFSALVQGRVAADLSRLRSWRAGCYTGGPDQGRATQVASWTGQIYAGRYASVTINIRSNPGCAGVDQSTPYSFTLDLTTAKPVPLSRFASTNSGQLRAAIVWYLRAKYPTCVDADLRSQRDGNPFALPLIRNWTVSTTGVSFWFEKYEVGVGACGTMVAKVPWSDILRPSQIGTSSTTSRMYNDLTDAVLTTRGRKVALYFGGEGGEVCARGVLQGSTIIAYFLDGSDYRKTWSTSGTGSSRVLVGDTLATPDQYPLFWGGRTAESLCS